MQANSLKSDPVLQMMKPWFPTRIPSLSRVVNELPANYVCNRCQIKGHHIRDCPHNGNAVYAPYNGKGIPKVQRYKQFGLNT
jgi:hypothetical protein